MNRRHDSYEDYAKEIDEQAERAAHEEGECAEWCPYCADDEEQMSRDVDELVDHVNNELERLKEGAHPKVVEILDRAIKGNKDEAARKK